METMVVYSAKVLPSHLEGAKKFFSRVGLPLQEAVRGYFKMAADCEACLELVEKKAPVEQVQSAFASIIADAKETWRVNGMFQEVMLRTARECGMPLDFINNVLAEAGRTYRNTMGAPPREV